MPRPALGHLVGLVAASLFAPLHAQGPARIFLDLETQTTGATCWQRLAPGAASANGLALFAVAPNGGGLQLWRSDGTAAGTRPLRDFDPLFPGRDPRQMVFANGNFFFNAGREGIGDELWCSDGTASGTRLLGDLRAGPLDSRPGLFTPFNGGVLFQAYDELNGSELWFSDGTPQGTRLVADLEPGSASSGPGPFTVLGGVAIFSTFYGELWRTDGTVAGTFELGAAHGLLVARNAEHLASFAGRAWFAGTTAANGTELWATDGTIAGTSLVYDIYPGSSSSTPRALRVAGGLLYFAAGVTGASAAYATDGAQLAPTSLRDAAYPSSLHDEPLGFTEIGGRVCFSATRGDVGRELWVTNGSAAGTQLVIDLRPGRRDSNPGLRGTVAGRLLFSADDGSSGSELWISDGTSAGTSLLADLTPGSSGSTFGLALPLGSGVTLFTARMGNGGDQLLRTDGTTAGTQIVASFCPSAPSSYPTPTSRDLGSPSFFQAYVAGQYELWSTDGTSAGSRQVLRGSWSTAWSDGASVGTSFLFAGQDTASGDEPWISDGTANGTRRLADLVGGAASSTPREFTTLGERVLFTSDDGAHGRELWVSDGTAAGTRLLLDLLPGASGSNPVHLVRCGELAFFIAAAPGSSYSELWRSDGTAAGTIVLTGGAGAASPYLVPNSTTLFAAPDALYFVAQGSSASAGLWRSDGTPSGTVRISDTLPYSAAYGARGIEFAWWRDALWFVGYQSASGYELWTSDGTSTGTRLAFELAPGSAHYSPRLLGALGDRLYFSADDGVHGRELWSTSGTAAGTSLLLDLFPGLELGVPLRTWFLALPSAQRALFLATDGVHGFEIWRTDGTASGTVLHADLFPGPLSAVYSRWGIEPPTLVGSRLLMPASDDTHGIELFAMDAMAAGAPYGSGCGGTPHRVPRLESRGTPHLGNARHALEVRDGAPFAWAQILVAPASGFDVLSPGCVLWLDATRLFLASEGLLDARGTLLFPVPIPADPLLVGAPAFAQVLVRDPLTPPPGLALSAGYQVIVASN
jgi:ELWxxDGT repeat protein